MGFSTSHDDIEQPNLLEHLHQHSVCHPNKKNSHTSKFELLTFVQLHP
jgi:hypothetical protein